MTTVYKIEIVANSDVGLKAELETLFAKHNLSTKVVSGRHPLYNKIDTIKTVREKMGLGLKEAKELVESFENNLLTGQPWKWDYDRQKVGRDNSFQLITQFETKFHKGRETYGDKIREWLSGYSFWF